MADLPRSLSEFEQRFGDEVACAHYLATVRWPDGFACPGCGGTKVWRLEAEPWTGECVCCGSQTSVTAGTIMHHSKLPLSTRFWAGYVMATQPNGISTLQLNLHHKQRRRNMRFPRPSNQSYKNIVQRLLFTALLLLAPIIDRADEFDDRKNHLQRLIDQANAVRDTLGPNFVSAVQKVAVSSFCWG
jgi:Transposase zinc-ribbon domain